MRGDKLSGFVDFHSDVNEIVERADGQLLLEFSHPFNADDYFYFFIADAQFSDRDLVKSNFTSCAIS